MARPWRPEPAAALLCLGDPAFFERLALRLDRFVPVAEVDPETAAEVFPRALPVVPLPSGTPVTAQPGMPDSAYAGAVIESISAAVAW